MAKPNQKKNKPVDYPTITRAELAGGYFNKHVTFVIKTPSGNEIKRRYTDFEWLRGRLKIIYPGAFLPPIPPKLPVAMWPQGYLLMRKRELQQFLQRLEVIPYLKETDITQFFLNKVATTTFDKAKKKWEKDHPKPSDQQTYEKLIETFPKIHEAKTPEEMDKRCRQSAVLIDESIKQLEIMVRSITEFVKINHECAEIIGEFGNCFKGLIEIENKGVDCDENAYCKEKRIDVTGYLDQWKNYKTEEVQNVNVYYIPTLNRALNDLKVIQEIIDQRQKLQNDYFEAKRRANAWSTATNSKAVRSSDLAKKHREIQKEEDLRKLVSFVEKLVLGQLNVVFCANTRRWKKSCQLFASKHLISLEKVLGSWKDLANKVLKEKGKMDEIYKSVTVETLDGDDDGKDDNKQNDDNNNNDPIDLGADVTTIDLNDENDGKNDETNEEKELRELKEKEEQEKLQKELEEQERIQKEKDEQERLEKEKADKEKAEKDAESKKKMAAMFKNDSDDENDQDGGLFGDDGGDNAQNEGDKNSNNNDDNDDGDDNDNDGNDGDKVNDNDNGDGDGNDPNDSDEY